VRNSILPSSFAVTMGTEPGKLLELPGVGVFV